MNALIINKTLAGACLQVAAPSDNAGDCYSVPQYWGGYHWKVMLDKEDTNNLGVYIMPCISSRKSAVPQTPDVFLPATEVRTTCPRK